jgi:L-ribulose-5-phosphate 3-epimerase
MLKNKVGVATTSYMGLALEDALKGVSKAGFSYVEIAAAKGIIEHIRPDKMGSVEVESLRKQLKSCNLELVTISGHSDLTKVENVPYIKSCINLAKKLGAEFVTTGVDGDSLQVAIQQFYKNMEELGEYAVEKGVTICLETHGGFVATGKEVAKVVQNINSEGVKINYDTANVIFYGGVRPEEDLKYALENLGHVHLKDKIGGKGIWNFPPLGEGTVDFELLFKMFIEKGYSGPFTIEIEFQEDTKRTLELVNLAVKKSHDTLDNLFSRLSW